MVNGTHGGVLLNLSDSISNFWPECASKEIEECLVKGKEKKREGAKRKEDE
jgi:hypothetical protein